MHRRFDEKQRCIMERNAGQIRFCNDVLWCEGGFRSYLRVNTDETRRGRSL